MRGGRDAGNDVTRQQARGELVRIVKNDHVIDGQAKRRGDRHGRSQRTLNRRWLHPANLLTAATHQHSQGLAGGDRSLGDLDNRSRSAGQDLHNGAVSLLDRAWPAHYWSWTGIRWPPGRMCGELPVAPGLIDESTAR